MVINLILCRRYDALIELGSHHAKWIVYVFCIMNYIGTKGEVCRQLKILLDPPVVYATERSKAVVPVLFLILCSFVVYTERMLKPSIFKLHCSVVARWYQNEFYLKSFAYS